MFLTQHNKHGLYKRFPGVELSYENTAYKKVHGADLYLAIPSKNKCFVWFTHFQDNNACFVISIVNDRFSDIRLHPCCFDKCLSLGTVLYGSLVTTSDKQTVFCSEDILQFKGRVIDKRPWSERFTYLSSCFTHMKPLNFSKNFMTMSMPLFSKDYKELEVFIEHSVYDVGYIQARMLDSQRFSNFNINQINRNQRNALPTATLLVRPCLQTDIYDLYCYSRNVDFYDVANIPDYKTSKLMNSIFRNIRENIDLDAIEESDDEDDFENIAEDKYVDMKKTQVMRCVYSFRFKRWTPKEALDSKSKLTTYKELKLLEKKN